MRSNESLKTDPVSLAESAALNVFYQSDSFEMHPDDDEMISHLNKTATGLMLVDKNYRVDSSRSVSLPQDFESYDDVDFIKFTKLSFEGIFACYAKIMIEKNNEEDSIRALCLTFHETTLLPYLDKLPARHLLYVPVHAIDNMALTDAIAA